MNFSFSKGKNIEENQGKKFISYWLKRIFIEDWLIKLLALVITMTLWFGVIGSQDQTQTRLRGISLNPLISNDLEITNSPAQEIDLVVSGDKRKLDQLNPNNLVVSLDLTDIGEGDREIQITPQNIKVDLPTGVKIDSIQPDKLAIQLEKVQERNVPVRVETEGSLAEGFEVYNTEVSPKILRVRGPRSFVESLNFIATEKINLNGRKADFTVQQIPINLNSSKISPVNAASVTVNFSIGQRRIEARYTVSFQTETKKGRADVTLYGADAILDKLSADEISVVEDKNIPKGFRVILPENLRDKVEIRNEHYRLQ